MSILFTEKYKEQQSSIKKPIMSRALIPSERPKPNPALWEALKEHIHKERQKKKLEEQLDEEVERQRREKEDKEKATALTLEETKEEIVKLEKRLSELREEKHLLFNRLKQVLHEDETRRRQKEIGIREVPSLSNSMHHGVSLPQPMNVTHAPVYGVAPPTLLVPASQKPQLSYKQSSLGMGSQTAMSQLPPAKRPRSPSPVPLSVASSQIHSPYPFKTLPFQVTGAPRGTLGLDVQTHGTFYPVSSAPGYSNQQRMMYSYGGVGAPAYPVMTKEDEGKTVFTNAAPSGRDKMSPYSTASAGTHEMARSGHPGLLPGGLPVHTQQVKSGGISSGQPVRSMHGSPAYPPPTHNTVGTRVVYSSPSPMIRPPSQGPRF
ncbi:G protein pathway suppressor 2-like isoform X2 [Artemia franciscana]